MGWFKAVFDWIGRWQVAQSIWLFAKPFLLPFVLAAAAGGAGWMGQLPLMWIIMACALTFMGVMVGVFFGGTSRDRNTTQHKILYQGTQVNYDLTHLPGEEGALRRRGPSQPAPSIKFKSAFRSTTAPDFR